MSSGNLADNIPDRESIKPQSFEPIPAGTYKSIIKETSVEPTRAGDGLVLKFKEEIVEGEYEGRVLFCSLNVQNPSEKAQQIGRGQIASVGRACGLPGIPADSAELEGKAHLIKVVVEPGSGINPATNEPYPAKNVVKAWMPTLAKVVSKPVTAATEKPASALDQDSIPF